LISPASQASAKLWHALPAKDALLSFEADAARGLDVGEAERRLALYGPNQLQQGSTVRPLEILLGQFKSLLVWILIAAALIAAATRDLADCIAIVAIVVLNAVLGFFQEYKAERSIAALQRLTAPRARVRRGGRTTLIPARKIVPGDVVELEAGDLVPADARLLESSSLQTIEASLTGEPIPVEKDARTVAPEAAPLGDRAGMVHMGTSVAAGRGSALVVATGMGTEIGGIAGLITTAGVGEVTPLQRQLAAFGRMLVWSCLAVVALVFLAGIVRGMPVFELLLTSISLAVAAVPEGLPAVVTIALAVGVQRMARKRSLIRRLHAVETLGAASVICSDKTGTLTVGEMTVRELYTPACRFDVSGEGYVPEGEIHPERGVSSDPARALLEIFAGCNGAALRHENDAWSVIGDPTEGALLVAAGKLGVTLESIEAGSSRVRELPFDSERKRMTVVRRVGSGVRAMVKGAPDVLLERCTHILDTSGPRLITSDDRAAILSEIRRMSTGALRVLAAAYRDVDGPVSESSADALEVGLVFVGLAGMNDPPRAEARAAVRLCRDAGIRVVMITGDHPGTARAVARELEIADSPDQVLSGGELDDMSDANLAQRAPSVAVYARVTASHKLRIVRALQASGSVVAMTGDGVNDAPAIKGADIGIAMGRTGTEVTKAASDMVITDDNFATIVEAVQEGRGIYANIRKTIQYLLAGNTGELIFVATCVLVGLPMPLLAIQLLWINLVTDGFPALCLAIDPIDPDLMKAPPRKKDGRFVDRGFLLQVGLTGFLTAATVLAVYTLELRSGNVSMARNHAFATLVFIELLRAFAFRSESKPLWRTKPTTNLKLFVVVLIGVALQLSTPHIAPLRDLLQILPMPVDHCFALLGVSFVPVVLLEVIKPWQARRKP
jgi:Ca2+-transporting ATPase